METVALQLSSEYQKPADRPLLKSINQASKPRLGATRAELDMDDPNLKEIIQRFVDWSTYNEYMVFKNQHVHSGEIKYNAKLMSKRGNRFYAYRQQERFKELEELPDVQYFNWRDRSKRQRTRGLFVTLEADSNEYSISESWEGLAECKICGHMAAVSTFNAFSEEYKDPETGELKKRSYRVHCDTRIRLKEGMGYRWNKWITAMRKRYGDIQVIRTWESHKSGYPHIHAILFFKDHEFDAFYHRGKNHTWRIQGKHEIADLWDWGFSDVEALSSVRGGIKYVTKYLTKVNASGVDGQGWSSGLDASDGGMAGLVANASVLTLALSWVFRKRSYSISRGLRESLDEIEEMHNSNPVMRQSDLSGSTKLWEVTLMGFWGGYLFKKGGSYPVWGRDLTNSEYFKIKGAASWNDNSGLMFK